MAELKVLISRQDIAKRVVELGEQITKDFAGQSVIFVGVLKGAAIFLADLARQVQLDSTFDFIGVSSYGNRPSPANELKSGWDSTGEVRLLKDVDQSIKDKNIILVEDILDTGLTMTYLKKMLLARQPRSLQSGRAARQTVAAQASARRRLRRVQDSRRVRSRLRTGLCGEVPQSG